MRLESDRYFQGKQNVEAYIDEFKNLINLSGYTDPIAIVLKFRRGLNSTTQDRITESGTDRPSDMDFNGWFKAARCLDLNRLANEAFHLASRRPPTHSTDNPNTTQTLEYTKDKYNVKIIKRKVSPKVPPTTYVGQRVKERRCEGDEQIITIKRKVEDF
jgi:hypothetical protein